jgi:hypothetical protein
MTKRFARREFLKQSAMGIGAVAAAQASIPGFDAIAQPINRPEYTGPNIIIVRFGGGVRRQETIDSQQTYSPYFLRNLCPRGVLFNNMSIDHFEGVDTSHGQGTLYILTGKYDKFKDVGNKFLGQRFESQVPTLFEYMRSAYAIPDHQTLIVNGEDRTDEEFYSFSNHHLFGAEYKSNTLSLYRFKVYLLRKQIQEGRLSEKVLAQKQKELAQLEQLDYRLTKTVHSPEIDAFWRDWRAHYGDSGFVNPRGDRLLTQLSVWAIKKLRPKLMMINYNDPDYVHWGDASFYTRGIQIIDQGLERLVEVVEADEEYRDNTIFAVVPDCGRDSNRAMAVPYQHHFNSKSAHEIFGLFFGPGIAKNRVVDFQVDQISVAATLGSCMGLQTQFTEGDALADAFA